VARAAVREHADTLWDYPDQILFLVNDEEQERRFQERMSNLSKRWKLSTMDLQSRRHWMDYSKAKDEMFEHTDTKKSPWYVVNAYKKKRASLNGIAHLLKQIPYDDMTPVERFRLGNVRPTSGPRYRNSDSSLKFFEAASYSTAIFVPCCPALDKCAMRRSMIARIPFRNSIREFVKCSRTSGDTPNTSRT
jgi:hypothetical protein